MKIRISIICMVNFKPWVVRSLELLSFAPLCETDSFSVFMQNLFPFHVLCFHVLLVLLRVQAFNKTQTPERNSAETNVFCIVSTKTHKLTQVHYIFAWIHQKVPEALLKFSVQLDSLDILAPSHAAFRLECSYESLGSLTFGSTGFWF